jgi:nicotinamidase-related amidase
MKYCLVIVDMQKGIFELKQPVCGAESLVQNISRAVRFAREKGIAVAFSRHENNSFLKCGTAGHDIIDALEACEGDSIIPKKHPDVFADTRLDDILKTEGIGGLIVTGLISNGCVKDACLSALKRGYEVILLSNAHSTFYSGGNKIVEAVNREMEKAGARVAPVAALPDICAF